MKETTITIPIDLVNNLTLDALGLYTALCVMEEQNLDVLSAVDALEHSHGALTCSAALDQLQIQGLVQVVNIEGKVKEESNV